MFPVHDENPHFITPFVTYGILVANALAWMLVQGGGAEVPLVTSLCERGLIPAHLLELVPDGTLVPLGPHQCELRAPADWSTTLTHMFLHGGWFHLLGNLWFLWIFGNNVEDSMGHLRFLVFYVVCGLAAAGAQVVSQPESTIPMVGASGAIGGVMGAYIVLYPRVRVHMVIIIVFIVRRVVVPAVFMLGYWFFLQLVGGAMAAGRPGGGVAFWAHVGGFAAGAVLVFVFRDPALVRRHPYTGWSPRRR